MLFNWLRQCCRRYIGPRRCVAAPSTSFLSKCTTTTGASPSVAVLCCRRSRSAWCDRATMKGTGESRILPRASLGTTGSTTCSHTIGATSSTNPRAAAHPCTGDWAKMTTRSSCITAARRSRTSSGESWARRVRAHHRRRSWAAPSVSQGLGQTIPALRALGRPPLSLSLHSISTSCHGCIANPWATSLSDCNAGRVMGDPGPSPELPRISGSGSRTSWELLTLLRWLMDDART
mmetsp:Transcript_45873/g.121246  ORF Transcript_45873/g.121246 Transcript_45873/m.121246 type:complete len:234 (-) Transcript_45873:551-1252(-)